MTAALAFPTALFSFALVVVACYWCLVIIGALGVDTLDPDVDGTTELGGLTAAMSALGLHGVPVTVSLSTMIRTSSSKLPSPSSARGP